MGNQMISVDSIIERIDREIHWTGHWIQQEAFSGNTDKESWWKGADTEARKIKAIIINELVGKDTKNA